jgi:F0F1-type ATP synthase assembly protein I
MGKVIAILGGIIAIACGVYLVLFVWSKEFIDLVFGCIPLILFFGGLIAFIAGISSIKDAARTKKLEQETEEEEEKEEEKEEKDNK